MACKENKIVMVSGSVINGRVATSDYTTDAQRLLDLPWSVNVSFSNTFAVSGSQPTIQIQMSDDPNNDYTLVDLETFNNLKDGFFAVPEGAKSRYYEYRWIRFVYSSNGVTAGTIKINLVQ